MTYYNTLDIDNSDKENLSNIIQKIVNKKCCLTLGFNDSSTKGYHIKLVCSKKCDECRLVFDDVRRFELDSVREEKFRNVLFTEKEIIKGGGKKPMEIIEAESNEKKHYCDRCLKYSIKTELEKKLLNYKDTQKKVKIGKISNRYPIKLIFLFYIYLECPKCKWFKFVKDGGMRSE